MRADAVSTFIAFSDTARRQTKHLMALGSTMPAFGEALTRAGTYRLRMMMMRARPLNYAGYCHKNAAMRRTMSHE